MGDVYMIDEALDKACEFIADRTGSCPLDTLDVEPWLPAACGDVCNVPPDSAGPCWKEYFLWVAAKEQ